VKNEARLQPKTLASGYSRSSFPLFAYSQISESRFDFESRRLSIKAFSRVLSLILFRRRNLLALEKAFAYALFKRIRDFPFDQIRTEENPQSD